MPYCQEMDVAFITAAGQNFITIPYLYYLHCRGGSRISKGGVDGRPYLLRGARENALTKKNRKQFFLYLFTPGFLISKYSPDVVQL